MRRFTSVAVLILVALSADAPAPAQSLDPASAEALATVLRMLQDPVARGAGIAANPEAAAVDRNVRAMTGGSAALLDEFYALAAQVFTDLVQGAGGDLTRMQKSLAEGQRDPAGFAAFLSPATLQHLRDFSGRVSDQKR
jgi:hypothetical protein